MINCLNRVAFNQPSLQFISKSCLQRNQTVRKLHLVEKSVTRKIKIHKYHDVLKKPRPLCVLLGWGNSKQKHLKKYREVFESRGFDTITVTPNLTDLLVFPETKGLKISEKILQTISEEFGIKKIPVVFYQFSNGGCGLYYLLCREICKNESPFHKRINLIGSVFDSCPVVPSLHSVSIAQNAFTQNIKNPMLKALLWYSVKFFLPFVIWFNPTTKVFISSLKDLPIKSAQIFFYSKQDLLAPYEDITDFIEYRKNIGVPVTAKLWDNTPHVSHMKYDKETYSKMLNDFIDKLDV